MKAEELRIGNWVNDPIHNENDVQISETMFCVFVSDWKNELKPIPITDEWLLKFGFIDDEINGYKKAIHKCKAIILDREDRVHITDSTSYGIVIAYSIKKVHQIQNLYFALTGEELCLK